MVATALRSVPTRAAKRSIRRGRPLGSKTADPVLAVAFGTAVRSTRTTRGIAQEALAHLARIERSHVDKIERGEHMPKRKS